LMENIKKKQKHTNKHKKKKKKNVEEMRRGDSEYGAGNSKYHQMSQIQP